MGVQYTDKKNDVIPVYPRFWVLTRATSKRFNCVPAVSVLSKNKKNMVTTIDIAVCHIDVLTYLLFNLSVLLKMPTSRKVKKRLGFLKKAERN